MTSLRRSARLNNVSQSLKKQDDTKVQVQVNINEKIGKSTKKRNFTEGLFVSDGKNDLLTTFNTVTQINNENWDLNNSIERTDDKMKICDKRKCHMRFDSNNLIDAEDSQSITSNNSNNILGFNNNNELMEESILQQCSDTRKDIDVLLSSPSTILNKLNFNKSPEQAVSFKSIKRHNKYHRARKVLNSVETLKLPGREKQLEELNTFIMEHLENNMSGSLYVSGQPGTGKTACLSFILQTPALKHRLQNVYINCTGIASTGSIYKKLCMELGCKSIGRTDRDYLRALHDYFTFSSKMTLIVLDEIDQLCNVKLSVMYTIFEWPSIKGSRLLLVGIANSLDLTERTLLRLNVRCELKPRHMHFPPYTKQQIVDIFHTRLEEANVLNIFPSVTLQLLAAKVSAVSGDVRRALDIGRRVVEIAEQHKASEKQLELQDLDIDMINGETIADNPHQLKHDGKERPIEINQVTSVINAVYGVSEHMHDDFKNALTLQQKLMLGSLLLMWHNDRNKDITIGRLIEVYRRVCKKRNIQPLDQAEFVSLVDLVQTRGIINVVRKKEPRLYRVHLQWDFEDVRATLSDKQLLLSILNDIACLTK